MHDEEGARVACEIFISYSELIESHIDWFSLLKYEVLFVEVFARKNVHSCEENSTLEVDQSWSRVSYIRERTEQYHLHGSDHAVKVL